MEAVYLCHSKQSVSEGRGLSTCDKLFSGEHWFLSSLQGREQINNQTKYVSALCTLAVYLILLRLNSQTAALSGFQLILLVYWTMVDSKPLSKKKQI